MLTTVLGRSVMAERYGTAPGQVLALHGWGRSREDFGAVLTGLDGLALDLPGFGTTPAPASAWSTADYAEALAPLLAEMDSPVVVGHSFGGRVAAHLAALRPSLVRGVVFTGAPLIRPSTTGGATKPALSYRAVRLLARLGVLPESRLEAARRKYGSADYRNATGVMRDVLVQAVNETYEASLAAMAAAGVPTRFVWGAGDTAAPLSAARTAAGLVGSEVTVIEGSAHLLDPGLSAAVRDAVLELLASGTAVAEVAG